MSTSYLDNYYARLGVPMDASPETIRSAYFLAARHYHPDSNSDLASTELFLQIQEAYEHLSDPVQRSSYDLTIPSDITPPAEIFINPLYSRTALPLIDETQLVYILLDMMPTPSESDNRGNSNTSPPLNISLVIDTSTSMAGKRMDVVKSSATELLRRLNPEDTLSIVTFNDRAEIILPASRGEDYHTLESRISFLQTGGGTEMFQGLKAGFKEVNQNISSTSVNHIILITDGRTYGDEKKCLNLAKNASTKGVTISALGIGSEWNDEFIDQLTAITGGSSAYAAKPRDIRKFFKSKLDRLSSTYADKVSMQMTTGKNVELRYAFRLSPEPGPLATEPEMNLGHIPRESSLSVIMEFAVESIPPDSESLVIANGTLKLDVPSRTIPSTTSRFSFIRPVVAASNNDPPPQALIKAMARLSLYRLQEQARLDFSNGDVEKATTRLQNLATQLLLSGEPDLAQTVLLELKSIETGSIISDETKKKIKYGTRALLLPAGEIE